MSGNTLGCKSPHKIEGTEIAVTSTVVGVISKLSMSLRRKSVVGTGPRGEYSVEVLRGEAKVMGLLPEFKVEIKAWEEWKESLGKSKKLRIPNEILNAMLRSVEGKGTDADDVAGCNWCITENLTHEQVYKLMACVVVTETTCPMGRTNILHSTTMEVKCPECGWVGIASGERLEQIRRFEYVGCPRCARPEIFEELD